MAASSGFMRSALRNVGLVERGHLGQDSLGRFDQVHRQRRAGAFAQPQAQVQERLLAQAGVHGAMALLRAAVGGDDVLARRRTKRMGQQRAGRGNETVDDDRLSPGGGAEHDAGNAADLEAAHLGQHVQGIARDRAGSTPGPFPPRRSCWASWPSSMPVPRPVTSATGSPVKRGHDGGRRRGVGDAHVAGAEHVGRVGQLLRRLRCPPRRPARPARGSWPARRRCWPCPGRFSCR